MVQQNEKPYRSYTSMPLVITPGGGLETDSYIAAKIKQEHFYLQQGMPEKKSGMQPWQHGTFNSSSCKSCHLTGPCPLISLVPDCVNPFTISVTAPVVYCHNFAAIKNI
jgi:hypothetical protein